MDSPFRVLGLAGVTVLVCAPAGAEDHPEAVIVTHDREWGIGATRRVAAGDLDGDGTADLVAGNTGIHGSVAIVSGPAYGRADIHRFPKVAERCCDLGETIGLGDHDLDGTTDLLTSGDGAQTWLFLGPITADTGPGMADAILIGNKEDIAGTDVDVADDVDGDGAPDIIIGAPYAGESYEGAVFVASGPVVGRRALETATYLFEGEAFNELGRGTTSVGDLTGDGVGDLALAAAGSASDFGSVYLVEGGAAPGAYAPEDAAWAIFRSADEGSDLDRHDVVARDYDGDGATDLLMADSVDPGFGGFPSGAAYAVLGPFAGEESLTDADTTWSSESISYLGQSFAAGDFDGDAELDLVVGAYQANDYDGIVYVQRGTVTGSVDVKELPTLRTRAPSDTFGMTLVAVPDWTGDGGDEVAVSAPYALRGRAHGAILVFESDSMFD